MATKNQLRELQQDEALLKALLAVHEADPSLELHVSWEVLMERLQLVQEALSKEVKSTASAGIQALIFGKNQEGIERVCMGPDEMGRCSLRDFDHPVACAGRRIMIRRLSVDIAPDTEDCPIAFGIMRNYLEATKEESFNLERRFP
jgi:hypothetical protein